MTLQINMDAVSALAGSADTTLYAARASGLYRSVDGGSTWQNTFATLDQPDLTAVAVAAVGHTVFAGVKGAVLRSDDAGDTWHIAGLVAPPPLVVALALSPDFEHDHTVLAGTAEDGVFVSTDRGETWVPWNFGLLDLNVYTLACSPNFAQDHTVFVGTESGIFRSSNSGRGWRELPFPMEAAPVLALHSTASGTLYAGTEDHGLYVADDEGATWRPIPTEELASPINAITVGAAGQLIVLLEDKLLRSPNAGQTWVEPALVFSASQSALALLPLSTGQLLVGFADGTIQRVTP